MSNASVSNHATHSTTGSLTRTFADPVSSRVVSPAPIRVLAFIEADRVAGAVKPVLEFANEAAASPTRNTEVRLVVFVRGEHRTELIDIARERGIPIDLIHESIPFNFGVVPQLRDVVRRWRPDIIWTNNYKSHFLVRLSGLHRRAPWVAFHHGYTQEAWRTNIYNQFDRWSLRGARRVITVCDHFARDLQQRGVPEERISVQRNPIRLQGPVSEAEKQRLRSELGLANDCKVLLSIGRLSKEKGHADLLHAMARLRSRQNNGATAGLHLLLVGSGPEQASLSELRTHLGLGDVVHLTGYQSDVRPYYAISDLFVLPSHSEGSPNVLLEAMVADLPMVATAVGGIPEVLKNEESALLVPKGAVSELADAVECLLNDPLRRQRFTRRCKELVAQHDPPSYYQNISRIFEEVLVEARAA